MLGRGIICPHRESRRKDRLRPRRSWRFSDPRGLYLRFRQDERAIPARLSKNLPAGALDMNGEQQMRCCDSSTGLERFLKNRLRTCCPRRNLHEDRYLWTGLSGYMNACLKELSSREGVELFVCHQIPAEDAPFDDGQFAWISHRIAWQAVRDLKDCRKGCVNLPPRLWFLPRGMCQCTDARGANFANRCWRVMAMDNPWRGSLKQRLGVLVSPLFLKPITDVVWLPGERQAIFARRLGFSQGKICAGFIPATILPLRRCTLRASKRMSHCHAASCLSAGLLMTNVWISS